ncbi:hypothetical protein TRE132_38850 [Pseudomonas chlororaphis subsp. aurantiaca]|nr:hypothetical protein TRE132_38850 [Pseudomonas chlororaphis subsp. aurantiaca]
MAIESPVAVSATWPRQHIGKLLLLAVAVAWLVYFTPHSPVLKALLQWSPALIVGFGQNILISLLAIGLGSLLGLSVGAWRCRRCGCCACRHGSGCRFFAMRRGWC